MTNILYHVLAFLIWLLSLMLYLLPLSLIAIMGWLLGYLDMPKPFGFVIFSGFSVAWLFCWGIYIYIKMQGLFSSILERLQGKVGV